MPEHNLSPIARLVIVLVCLSAVAALAAGIHYFAIDLPQQNAAPPVPVNAAPYVPCPFPEGGPYFLGCYEYLCDKHCCESVTDMTIIGQGPCLF